jgi:hypothetical protein
MTIRNIVVLLSFSAAFCGIVPHSEAAQPPAGDVIFDGSFEFAPVAGPCAGFYPDSFALAEGRNAGGSPATAGPRPVKGQTFGEPNFGTCMVRTTDHRVEYPPAAFLREDYSRRQAFNADNSRFFVFGSNGYWHLYDANSLAYVRVLDGLAGDAEPQWHPSNPSLLYYVPNNGGTVLYSLNVETGARQTVADFSGRLPAWAQGAAHIWTKSEGSPSADARYWGFMVENGSFSTLGFIVWDLVQNRLVGSRQSTYRPDHVSMSPSGRWFTTSGFDGTWAWSPDFTQKKKLHHTTEHSDLAIGADGHDLYVSIDYQSNGGDVFYIDVDACPAVPADATNPPECPRTVLFPTYVNGSTTALHISGKAYARPGWVVITPYGTALSRDGSMPWFGNKVFAMQLNANPQVYELARHNSVGVSPLAYWSEPQSSVNRDLTRILFNSSWYGTDQTDIEAYLIQLPHEAIR